MSISTTVDAITAEPSFKEFHPVAFRILNDKFEEKLYLENTPASGLLELRNSSGGDLFFIPPSMEHRIAGPDHYHFALKFRPGILRSTTKSLIKNKMIKKGWALSIGLVSLETGKIVAHDSRTPMSKNMVESTTTVLYFLNTITGSLAKNQSLTLPLKHLRLQCDEGTQRTQVELQCSNLASDKELTKPLKSHIRHYNLTIINHRGIPHMPLHVGFTGFNTILNDGDSPNKLTLRITNLQKKTPEHSGEFVFDHRKRSKIYLYFTTDAESSDVAIGPVDKVSEFEIDINTPVQDNESALLHEPMFQGNNPIWEIFPDYGNVVLQPHLTKASPYLLLKSPTSGSIKRISNGANSQNDLLVEFDSEAKLENDQILFQMDTLAYDLFLLGMMSFTMSMIGVKKFTNSITAGQLELKKRHIGLMTAERNKIRDEIEKLKDSGDTPSLEMGRRRLQLRKVSKILSLLEFDLKNGEIASNNDDPDKIELLRFLLKKITQSPYHSTSVGDLSQWNSLDNLEARLETLGTDLIPFRDDSIKKYRELQAQLEKLRSSPNYYKNDIVADIDYRSIDWLLDLPPSEEREIWKEGEIFEDPSNWILKSLRAITNSQKTPETSQTEDWMNDLLQRTEFVVMGQTLARIEKKQRPLNDSQRYDLPDDSCFDIVISEIVSDYFMGTTQAFLRFENIPGYWDHTYSIPIIKQPMVFKNVNNEEYVGIGTVTPTAKLELHNNDYNVIRLCDVRTNAYGSGAHIIMQDRFSGSPSEAIIGSIGNGGDYTWRNGALELRPVNRINFYKGFDVTNKNEIALTIHGKSGNVGIGIDETNEKLEVNGNIKFTDNGEISSKNKNHRILFRRNENKLELREYGDIVFSSGATRSQETAKMLIKSNGSVGIGTSDPKDALQIGSYGSDKNNYLSIKTAGGNRFKCGIKLRNYADDDGFTIESDETKNQLKIIRHAQTNSTALIINRLDGHVGIGNSNPGYPLEISGQGNTYPSRDRRYFNSGSDSFGKGASSSGGVVLVANGSVISTAWFLAVSDIRVKNIKTISDSKSDLETLMKVEVTDFKYVDKEEFGNRIFKKVIAQQIHEIYPRAINKSKGTIPSVFELAENVTTTLKHTIIRTKKLHNFKTGDKVKLIEEGNGLLIEPITVVDEHTFSINKIIDTKIFVYGKEVDDLLSVDYDALSILNISATQELAKKVEVLQSENQKLKAEQEEMKKDLAALMELFLLKNGS